MSRLEPTVEFYKTKPKKRTLPPIKAQVAAKFAGGRRAIRKWIGEQTALDWRNIEYNQGGKRPLSYSQHREAYGPMVLKDYKTLFFARQAAYLKLFEPNVWQHEDEIVHDFSGNIMAFKLKAEDMMVPNMYKAGLANSQKDSTNMDQLEEAHSDQEIERDHRKEDALKGKDNLSAFVMSTYRLSRTISDGTTAKLLKDEELRKIAVKGGVSYKDHLTNQENKVTKTQGGAFLGEIYPKALSEGFIHDVLCMEGEAVPIKGSVIDTGCAFCAATTNKTHEQRDLIAFLQAMLRLLTSINNLPNKFTYARIPLPIPMVEALPSPDFDGSKWSYHDTVQLSKQKTVKRQPVTFLSANFHTKNQQVRSTTSQASLSLKSTTPTAPSPKAQHHSDSGVQTTTPMKKSNSYKSDVSMLPQDDITWEDLVEVNPPDPIIPKRMKPPPPWALPVAPEDKLNSLREERSMESGYNQDKMTMMLDDAKAMIREKMVEFFENQRDSIKETEKKVRKKTLLRYGHAVAKLERLQQMIENTHLNYSPDAISKQMAEAVQTVNLSNTDDRLIKVAYQKWLYKIRNEAIIRKCSMDPDVTSLIGKLKPFAEETTDYNKLFREKLCMILISLPFKDILDLDIQRAAKFILRELLGLKSKLLKTWLDYRNLYLREQDDRAIRMVLPVNEEEMDDL